MVREGFSGSSLDVPISTPGSVGTDTRLIQRAWKGSDFRIFRKFFPDDSVASCPSAK